MCVITREKLIALCEKGREQRNLRCVECCKIKEDVIYCTEWERLIGGRIDLCL